MLRPQLSHTLAALAAVTALGLAAPALADGNDRPPEPVPSPTPAPEEAPFEDGGDVHDIVLCEDQEGRPADVKGDTILKAPEECAEPELVCLEEDGSGAGADHPAVPTPKPEAEDGEVQVEGELTCLEGEEYDPSTGN